MMMKEPEQFTLDREDKIRKDLEGKINALDQKIDQKVSNHVFYWITPIILVGVFGYLFNQMNKLDDKTNLANDRLARIETKIDINNQRKIH